MRRVIIESPFAGRVIRNQNYARLCCAHALALGDAPFASHLLYTQDGILDDTIDAERDLGITAGLIWGTAAEVSCAYIDLGISDGMRRGIKTAQQVGRAIEIRSLSSPISLVWGQESIDEVMMKAPTVFGDGNAAIYCAAQDRIAFAMTHIGPSSIKRASTAIRSKNQWDSPT